MNDSTEEELYCKLCGLNYDENIRIPLIIPDCGHTFCATCIKKKLDGLHPEETFLCPIDKVVFFTNKRDISQFPKNLSILRLIEQDQTASYHLSSAFPGGGTSKFNTISALIKTPQEISSSLNQVKYEISFGLPPKSSPNNSFMSQAVPANTSLREQYREKLSISSNKPANNIENRTLICLEHHKILDLFCLEHKVRICSNCALFGAHRNHDVQSEEIIANSVSNRAERLLEIFEALDAKQKNLFSSMEVERLKKEFDTKTEEIKFIIKDVFYKWTETIKVYEKEVTSDINNKFKLIEKSLDEASKFQMDQFLLKVKEWKSVASQKLMSVSEKTSSDDFLFEMMPNKVEKLDVVILGEGLLSEITFPSSFPYREILETIEGFSAKPMSIDIRNMIKENLNMAVNVPISLQNKLEIQSIRPKEQVTLGTPKSHNMPTSQNNRANISPQVTSKTTGNKSTSSIKIFGGSNMQSTEKKKETKVSSGIGIDPIKPRDRINSTMLRQMIRETTPATEDNDLLHTELSKLGFSAFSDYKEPLSFEPSTSSKTENNFSGKRSVTPSGVTGQATKKSLNSSFNSSEATLVTSSGRVTIHHNTPDQNAKSKGLHVKQKSERSLTPTQRKVDNKTPGRAEPYDSLNNEKSSIQVGKSSRNTSRERDSNISMNRNSSKSPFKGNEEDSKKGKQENRVSTKFIPQPSGKNVGGRVSEMNLIKQKFKISEQFSTVLEGIKGDSLETVDLTCADIGDVGLSHLCEYLIDNNKVKALRLVKNKLTDEGVAILFKTLENNFNISNVNLTINMLSEKSVEAFYKLCQKNRTIKSIYFSQNNISSTKIKDLLKDLKNLGVTVYL